MHYKNGREAKVGDQVVSKDSYGNASGGILVRADPNSPTCNAQILPNNQLWKLPGINISDCLHVDDAFPAPVASETK